MTRYGFVPERSMVTIDARCSLHPIHSSTGGLEGFVGPIGLRLEAGDEIYLNNGTFNNLRVTAGPTFRF